jgi:hypothetical protein
MRSIRPLALSAAVLVALPVAAAVQVRQSIKSGDGSPPVERKLIVSESKVRVDEGTWSLIYDSDTGKVVDLNHAAKTWSESVMSQSAALDQDPVSMRYNAAFTQALALTGDSAAISVRPTDETRTIAGVPAKRADIYRDGILVRRSWHADSVDDGDLVQAQSMLATSPLASFFSDQIMIATRTALLGHTVRIEDVETGYSMEAIEIRKDKPAGGEKREAAGYRKVD